MRLRCAALILTTLGVLMAAPRSAPAINVEIDYRYDYNHFFDEGTPNGLTARATLEAAATFFSNIITDTLSSIPYTDPFTPSPQNTNVWRQLIMNPGTGESNYAISSAANALEDGLTPTQGAADEFRDIQIPQNEFLIYAGGTSLTSAGIGGTGVAYFGTLAFNDAIDRRGKPSGEYAAWGGYVSFDNDGGTNWHYNYQTPVPAGKVDLYSTALHEMGHVLGLCTSGDEWNVFQVGAEFRGPQALAAWKIDDPAAPPSATGVPTVSSVDHHWKDNAPTPPRTASVRSFVLGTTQLQEAAMDPIILSGTRKLFTNVDTKALRDIGWTIPNSVFAVQSYLAADFNTDGLVNGGDLAVWKAAFANDLGGNADGDGDTDGADFLLWQRQHGSVPSVSATAMAPEPAAIASALWSVLLAGGLRRRRASL